MLGAQVHGHAIIGTRLSMKLVNWNVEWATPGGRRSPEILERIRQHDPEIICLTETDVGLLDREQLQGHVVFSQADYGYTVREKRRKVLLWSKHKWREIDDVGGDDFPPGTVRIRRHENLSGRGHGDGGSASRGQDRGPPVLMPNASGGRTMGSIWRFWPR